MKKLIFLLAFFLPFYIFAESYHISQVNYNIESSTKLSFGTTRQYALEQAVPVDTNTVFENSEDFDNYLKDLERKLHNTRAFEIIELECVKDSVQASEEIVEILLNIHVKDSFHFLALPHVISYNSNEGWKPKLKAKDSNFLGSLNTMSGDFYGILPIASDNKNYEVGAEFAFNLPFEAGIFDAEWVNDYTFSYDFSKPTPEWEAQTGVKLIYPVKKLKFQFELYQYAFRNYEYEDFGDETYFTEEFCFSVPITILSLKNFDDLYYTPYTKLYVNWDFDSINILNTNLSSPTLSIGQSLSTSRVDWIGNYRRGASFGLTNNYYYYFQRMDFVPYLSFDAKYYNFITFFDSNYFNKLGFVSHLYTFTYFNKDNAKYYYGNNIGPYLRGIRDDQTYAKSTSFAFSKALEASTAIVLNIDLPFHLFTTNFTSKFMSIFNCDVQISPFIDIALCNNRETTKIFNLKDGFYAGGVEVLVYPKKWSSFTVRASLGLDLGRYLLDDYINMSWRKDVSLYELSVGLGLHY